MKEVALPVISLYHNLCLWQSCSLRICLVKVRHVKLLQSKRGMGPYDEYSPNAPFQGLTALAEGEEL